RIDSTVGPPRSTLAPPSSKVARRARKKGRRDGRDVRASSTVSKRPEGAGVEGEEMGGVSLSRYAGVRAGVGEGFELALVLACEEVDPAAWHRAERAWGARLAEEVDPTEGLGAAYAEALARAQERYGRRIRPIDEDLRAW